MNKRRISSFNLIIHAASQCLDNGLHERFGGDSELVEEDRPDEILGWEEDPLEVALSVVNTTFETADQELEARVTEWLPQDSVHWPNFRPLVLDPWHEQLERWREDAPG